MSGDKSWIGHCVDDGGLGSQLAQAWAMCAELEAKVVPHALQDEKDFFL